MRHVDDYLNGIKTLPPAPRVLPELLNLLREENVDSERVVSVIACDPGLTAKVLQLCNSAAYGLATPAEDLQEAVTRLGFNQVFQMVAALVGSATLAPPQPGYGIDRGELWKHSIAAAVAAECVARERGDASSIVYTATLLHDIGKIVLSDALVQEYGRLLADTEQNQQPLVEAERKILGTDHAEVGGRLLARWRLPASLVEAVTHHHAPAQAGEHARLAAYTYLGNMLAHFMGYGYGHVPFALRGRGEAMDILGLDQDSLPRFMIQTFERLNLINTLFRAGGGTAERP